jgi:hypothetical protein
MKLQHLPEPSLQFGETPGFEVSDPRYDSPEKRYTQTEHTLYLKNRVQCPGQVL